MNAAARQLASKKAKKNGRGGASQTASTRMPGGITNPGTKLNVYRRDSAGKDTLVGTADRKTSITGLYANRYTQGTGIKPDKVIVGPDGNPIYSQNRRKP